MARVVHFEITADNPERAADFYKTVFGWEINNGGGPQPYWLVKTGETAESGIDGAIMHRHDSGQKVINTVDVASWEKAAEAVTAAGGKVLSEKMPIAGVGTFAYCADTEGNIFGIMQADPSGRMG